MFLAFIKKNCIPLSLLIASTINFAKPIDPQIPCPTLDTIHEYANTIEMSEADTDGTYNAFNPQPIMANKTMWLLAVNYIYANSNEEAISIAKKILQNTNTQDYKYPHKMPWMDSKMYFCGYGQNIFLFGVKSDDVPPSLVKLGKFNLKQ